MQPGFDENGNLKKINSEDFRLSPQQRKNLETALHNTQVLIDKAQKYDAAGIDHGIDIEEQKAMQAKIKAMLRVA